MKTKRAAVKGVIDVQQLKTKVNSLERRTKEQAKRLRAIERFLIRRGRK